MGEMVYCCTGVHNVVSARKQRGRGEKPGTLDRIATPQAKSLGYLPFVPALHTRRLCAMYQYFFFVPCLS